MKRFALLLLAATLLGISSSEVVRNVPYVIAFRPIHSMKEPYVGQMFLTFDNGVISGRYTDISLNPGSPFANLTNVAVSGGISKDGTLVLVIRHQSFRGTMKGSWMSGNSTMRGRIYVFDAEQGKVRGF
jgi:hypothetical protein